MNRTLLLLVLGFCCLLPALDRPTPPQPVGEGQGEPLGFCVNRVTGIVVWTYEDRLLVLDHAGTVIEVRPISRTLTEASASPLLAGGGVGLSGVGAAKEKASAAAAGGGSYFGQLNSKGVPKTQHVNGSTHANGTVQSPYWRGLPSPSVGGLGRMGRGK